MLAERRPTEIAAELCEAGAVPGGDVDRRMEVEALFVRMQRDVPIDPRGIGIGTDALRSPARAAAQRCAPAHGRLRQPRQRERLCA